MREGFEKLPTRGTFTRASKGLIAEWYPMDYSDLEAIRRQGYFHETIGDTQQYSYRDFFSNSQSKNSKNIRAKSMSPQRSHSFNGGNTSQSQAQILNISNSGSVTLSPQRQGRRPSIGQHVSRMYKSSEGRIETYGRDPYAHLRKWHDDEENIIDEQGMLSPTNNTSFFKNTQNTPNNTHNYTNNVNNSIPFNESSVKPGSEPSVYSRIFGDITLNETLPVTNTINTPNNLNYNENKDVLPPSLVIDTNHNDDYSEFYEVHEDKPQKINNEKEDDLPSLKVSESPKKLVKQASYDTYEHPLQGINDVHSLGYQENVLQSDENDEKPQETSVKDNEFAAMTSYLAWLDKQQRLSMQFTSQQQQETMNTSQEMIGYVNNLPLTPKQLAMRNEREEDRDEEHNWEENNPLKKLLFRTKSF